MKMNQTTKIIFALFIIALMVLPGFAMESDYYQKENVDYTTIPARTMTVGYLHPFTSQAINLQQLSFVDSSATSDLTGYSITSASPAIGALCKGGTVCSSGALTKFGALCSTGQYMRLMEFQKITIPNGAFIFVYKRDLFDHLYLRETDSDYLDPSKYYTKDLDNYYVVYECYNKNSYTNAPTGKPVDIVYADVDSSTFYLGDTVTIKGVAEINKDVNGAIIMTNFYAPGITSIQPLSIISVNSQMNVCGTNKDTSGVKFNAVKGDKVSFTLSLPVTKTGKYTAKIYSMESCTGTQSDVDVVTFTVKNQIVEVPKTQPMPEIPDFTPDETPVTIPVIDETITNPNELPSGDNSVVITPNVDTAEFKLLDFEEQPGTSWGIVLTATIIILGLASIFFTKSGKKSRKR